MSGKADPPPRRPGTTPKAKRPAVAISPRPSLEFSATAAAWCLASRLHRQRPACARHQRKECSPAAFRAVRPASRRATLLAIGSGICREPHHNQPRNRPTAYSGIAEGRGGCNGRPAVLLFGHVLPARFLAVVDLLSVVWTIAATVYRLHLELSGWYIDRIYGSEWIGALAIILWPWLATVTIGLGMWVIAGFRR